MKWGYTAPVKCIDVGTFLQQLVYYRLEMGYCVRLTLTRRAIVSYTLELTCFRVRFRLAPVSSSCKTYGGS